MKAYHLMGKAPYFTNCYMITDTNGNAVLIDCSAEVEKVKAILENDRAQLKAILLTHGHHDHRETLAETVAEFACPVYLGADDAQLFGLEGTTDYEDVKVMKFGEIKLLPFSTPGHTPGGYCLWAEGMLFCGDTLFAGSCGRTDLPGGDWQTILTSLQRFRSFDGELGVFPGHGESSTIAREKQYNPFLR